MLLKYSLIYIQNVLHTETPSVWLQAIIAPIPKGGNKDPFIPTNYIGIRLLSVVNRTTFLKIADMA